jgi:hypothetical protein
MGFCGDQEIIPPAYSTIPTQKRMNELCGRMHNLEDNHAQTYLVLEIEKDWYSIFSLSSLLILDCE